MKNLKIKILTIFAILSFVLSANAKEFKIVQVADLNFDGNLQTKQAYNFEKFVNKINASDVDIVVFSGDNISSSKENELITLCNFLKKLNKPYYLALGENDVHKVNGIAKEDYIRFLDYHNPHQKSQSPNYIIKLSRDFIILIVDGSTPLLKSTHGYFSKNTLDWVEKNLAKNKKKKVAIFQHFPIVAPEEKESFKTIEPEKYNAILKKHKNVIFIASGHFNKDLRTIDENETEHISTPSFKNSPCVWREFLINTGRNFNYTTTLKEL